jgi:hypothetical protein
MAKKTDAKRRSRRRYRFTKEDCQRGYQAALAKCMEDWDLFAWLHRRVRGYYRKEKHP